MNSDIVIVDARAEWPDEFEVLRTALAERLGGVALRIDHIGSTSVPGLAAKDVIDVQVTVAELGDERVRTAMADIGAIEVPGVADHPPPEIHVEPGDLDKELYGLWPPNRRANIHVRVDGRFNQRYPLLCRDYLRTHPDAAAAYAEVKRQLADRLPTGDTSAASEAYYSVKDPVFDIIMTGAREWAARTGWNPA